METDKEVLLTRARQAREKYRTHAVVANLLHTRKRELWIITALGQGSENCEHISLAPSAETKSEIEEALIRRISELHNLFVSGNQ
ncbi:unnamed protein product [Dibothriocephalus latus]|uniref:Uncharacterized protein n=1 Tax=Dibothriocephalus latus TaxID=60516 RepID=A0A3P7PW57_DIBLA|nr:unnamed protein product [Dibothriocephalus latus]